MYYTKTGEEMKIGDKVSATAHGGSCSYHCSDGEVRFFAHFKDRLCVIVKGKWSPEEDQCLYCFPEDVDKLTIDGSEQEDDLGINYAPTSSIPCDTEYSPLAEVYEGQVITIGKEQFYVREITQNEIILRSVRG
jgi:hypothetical protein